MTVTKLILMGIAALVVAWVLGKVISFWTEGWFNIEAGTKDLVRLIQFPALIVLRLMQCHTDVSASCRPRCLYQQKEY